MLDLLGYDTRAKASRLATAALAFGLGRYGNFSFPVTNSGAFLTRLSNIRRRMATRSPWSRVRLGAKRKRYGRRPRRKGATYKRRGRRYTGRKYGRYRPLRTSMSVNDFRKFRCVAEYASDLNVTENTSAVNNYSFDVTPDLFPQYETHRKRFREFRLSNVQFVLEPRSVITGGQDIRVKNLEIPYLAARTVNPTAPSPTAVDAADIRRTPGYTFIPLARKKRTIINGRPQVILLSTMSVPGANKIITRHKAMPWLNTGSVESDLSYCRLEVRVPGLDAQNGDELKWAVRCYADLHFRGNLEDLVAPLPPIETVTPTAPIQS